MSDVNRTLTSLLLFHSICRHFWRIVVIEVSYILEWIFVFLEAQLVAHLIVELLFLNVFADLGFISTYCIRNTSKLVVILNDSIPTTKPEPQLHGFGLVNIHLILEKYHGEHTIFYENGWFQSARKAPIISILQNGIIAFLFLYESHYSDSQHCDNDQRKQNEASDLSVGCLLSL